MKRAFPLISTKCGASVLAPNLRRILKIFLMLQGSVDPTYHRLSSIHDVDQLMSGPDYAGSRKFYAPPLPLIDLGSIFAAASFHPVYFGAPRACGSGIPLRTTVTKGSLSRRSDDRRSTNHAGSLFYAGNMPECLQRLLSWLRVNVDCKITVTN